MQLLMISPILMGYYMTKFDIVIIGAGPAGLTAAIYGLREGLSVAIVEESDIGGKLIIVNALYNFPSYKEIRGVELAQKLRNQVEELGAVFIAATVNTIVKSGKGFIVTTNEAILDSGAVIIASGTRDKRLGIPGEEKYIGRGVSFCSLCDGPLFRGKDVCVIGAGDRAYTEAVFLSSFAKSVYILQRNKPRAEKLNIDKVQLAKNIHVLNYVEAISIDGDTKVRSIRYKEKNSNSDQVLAVSAVFPLIGNIPNTEFLDCLPCKSPENYIIVDKNMTTEIEGLYACGDVVDKLIRQVATSVGEGAIAGAMAARYVKHK